jgi:hypothetical protein
MYRFQNGSPNYIAEISRADPTLFIFLLDQSESMEDPFGGSGAVSKAAFISDAVNRVLHDLVIRSTKTEEVRNYYYISVIGYGSTVEPAMTGPLSGRELVSIAEVADYPARIEIRSKTVGDASGQTSTSPVRFPIWVDPKSENGTPMCQALQRAKDLAAEWVSDHPRSFPPTVLHLTDGESNDGNPITLAREIKAVATTDGNVLIFNCHTSTNRAAKVEYPADPACLPDEFARLLWEMSSILPDRFRRTAMDLGLTLDEGAAGFVFNADPSAVVQFFEIGSTSTARLI